MKHNKPDWWLLYAILPLMLGALVWLPQILRPGVDPRPIQIGVLAVGFGAMFWWVWANDQAIMWDEYELRDLHPFEAHAEEKVRREQPDTERDFSDQEAAAVPLTRQLEHSWPGSSSDGARRGGWAQPMNWQDPRRN